MKNNVILDAKGLQLQEYNTARIGRDYTDRPLQLIDDETFHIGDVVENAVASKIRCRTCGKDNWEVGVGCSEEGTYDTHGTYNSNGDYVAAGKKLFFYVCIRCPTCKYEMTLSDDGSYKERFFGDTDTVILKKCDCHRSKG